MRPLLVPLLCLAAVPLAGQAWAQERMPERMPHQVGIANQAGATIREIYIAPADASGWGGNRLVSQLPPGANASIRFTGPCQANLRIVMDGGLADERRAISVCDGTSFAVNAGSMTAVVGGAADTPPAVKVSMPVPAAGGSAAQKATPAAPAVVDQWNGHFLTKRYGGL